VGYIKWLCRLCKVYDKKPIVVIANTNCILTKIMSSRTVTVLTKFSGLTAKLKEVLPSVNFIEVEPTDLSQLQNAEIIVGDYNLFGPHIYNLPKVKWVQGTWAGIDFLLLHINKEAPPTFPITRTSGDNFGLLMSEYVLANIIYWERKYFKVRENHKEKLWDRQVCPQNHRSIADLKIGILGIGAIGNRIGRTLNSLGATIYGFGRRDTIQLETEEYKHITKYFQKVNLPEMLSGVDYLVNILPSTPETTNFFGK